MKLSAYFAAFLFAILAFAAVQVSAAPKAGIADSRSWEPVASCTPPYCSGK